jgi:hypothetical protein
MRILVVLGITALCAGIVPPTYADNTSLETLLRTQVFNKVFEGFDFYQVTIERDVANSDGMREVTAEAKGKFSEHTRRLKALFQLDGQTVVGGQVLEEEGLPACSSSGEHHPVSDL